MYLILFWDNYHKIWNLDVYFKFIIIGIIKVQYKWCTSKGNNLSIQIQKQNLEKL